MNDSEKWYFDATRYWASGIWHGEAGFISGKSTQHACTSGSYPSVSFSMRQHQNIARIVITLCWLNDAGFIFIDDNTAWPNIAPMLHAMHAIYIQWLFSLPADIKRFIVYHMPITQAPMAVQMGLPPSWHKCGESFRPASLNMLHARHRYLSLCSSINISRYEKPPLVSSIVTSIISEHFHHYACVTGDLSIVA